MKKVRTITLSGLLDSIPSDLSLDEKLLRDIPIGKKFTMRVLIDFYNLEKHNVYSALMRLEHNGYLIKKRGNFNNRNNITIYERIK
jgi:hypothetical protein